MLTETTPQSHPAAESAGSAPAGPEGVCRCGLETPSERAAGDPDPGEKRVRLTRMRLGEVGRVCGGRLEDADREMLRALGLRPDARVRLTRTGEPCIVQVLGQHGCSCRIGLAKPLAERVIVALERRRAER